MGTMSVPLTPAPLPELAYSRFRFEPPIEGVEHNEWTLRRATWTEMVVVNGITGTELAIPRVTWAGCLKRTKSFAAYVCSRIWKPRAGAPGRSGVA